MGALLTISFVLMPNRIFRLDTRPHYGSWPADPLRMLTFYGGLTWTHANAC